MNSPKTIACIGWGSLVWNLGGLPVREDWQFDGPLLPIEFARESEDRRITLVICSSTPRVRTCWVPLEVADMDAARLALGLREFSRANAQWIAENIGVADLIAGTASGNERETIRQWAAGLGLDGVVWTDLPPKFAKNKGRTPTCDEVITHLSSLEGRERDKAEEYVRKAPKQVDTPYRRQIEARLGWTSR